MRTLNEQLIIVAGDRKVLGYMASSVSGKDEAISTVIEYPSERRGANLPARDCPLCPARKIALKAEFFIGQDCSVKMAGHWPHVFFRV